MKNIFRLSTGIVILFTIMLTLSCGGKNKKNGSLPAVVVNDTTKKKDTIIYFIAFKEGEKMHLYMWNSYDPFTIGIDSLFYTDVEPGTTVYWELVEGSGITSMERIGPKVPGDIMEKDAEKTDKIKKLKLKIPRGAKAGEEEYDIVFKDNTGKTWKIDPYIRIPDPAAKSEEQ